jgi:hypothetical protein
LKAQSNAHFDELIKALTLRKAEFAQQIDVHVGLLRK